MHERRHVHQLDRRGGRSEVARRRPDRPARRGRCAEDQQRAEPLAAGGEGLGGGAADLGGVPGDRLRAGGSSQRGEYGRILVWTAA